MSHRTVPAREVSEVTFLTSKIVKKNTALKITDPSPTTWGPEDGRGWVLEDGCPTYTLGGQEAELYVHHQCTGLPRCPRPLDLAVSLGCQHLWWLVGAARAPRTLALWLCHSTAASSWLTRTCMFHPSTTVAHLSGRPFPIHPHRRRCPGGQAPTFLGHDDPVAAEGAGMPHPMTPLCPPYDP